MDKSLLLWTCHSVGISTGSSSLRTCHTQPLELTSCIIILSLWTLEDVGFLMITSLMVSAKDSSVAVVSPFYFVAALSDAYIRYSLHFQSWPISHFIHRNQPISRRILSRLRDLFFLNCTSCFQRNSGSPGLNSSTCSSWVFFIPPQDCGKHFYIWPRRMSLIFDWLEIINNLILSIFQISICY